MTPNTINTRPERASHHNQTRRRPSSRPVIQTKILNVGQVTKITKLYRNFTTPIVCKQVGIPFHRQTGRIILETSTLTSNKPQKSCFSKTPCARWISETIGFPMKMFRCLSENYLKWWKFWKILHLVFCSRRGKFSIKIERIRFYNFFYSFQKYFMWFSFEFWKILIGVLKFAQKSSGKTKRLVTIERKVLCNRKMWFPEIKMRIFQKKFEKRLKKIDGFLKYLKKF